MTASIVVLVNEDRVLQLAGFFQLFNDATNVAVHAGDLRCIHLHASFLPGFVFFVFPSGYFRISRREWPGGIDDPELFHLGMACFTKVIPTLCVATFVVLNVFGSRVQWPVGGVVSDIEKERFILRVLLKNLSE